MRITYVTESFPPDVNGVAHTAVRVAEQLRSAGHEPLVIAPEPARGVPLPDAEFSFPILRVPSVGVPVYPGFRVGLPGGRVRAAIAAHRADIVHLAGPFVLGAGAARLPSRNECPSSPYTPPTCPATRARTTPAPSARRSPGTACGRSTMRVT
ncbi:MAG: glycosyltransferase [Streptosporangiaceae bacterium]